MWWYMIRIGNLEGRGELLDGIASMARYLSVGLAVIMGLFGVDSGRFVFDGIIRRFRVGRLEVEMGRWLWSCVLKIENQTHVNDVSLKDLTP